MAKNETTTSAVLDAPAKDEAKAASKPEWTDDDLVTVLRKHWGTSGVPSARTDYIDRITFVGGVARNVPYAIAKKWQKSGTVGIHVLHNRATEEDFIRVTGIQPIDDGRLATLIRATDPERLAALLNADQLHKIAALQASNT